LCVAIYSVVWVCFYIKSVEREIKQTRSLSLQESRAFFKLQKFPHFSLHYRAYPRMVWSAWAYFRVEDPDTFVFSYILSLRCWKHSGYTDTGSEQTYEDGTYITNINILPCKYLTQIHMNFPNMKFCRIKGIVLKGIHSIAINKSLIARLSKNTLVYVKLIQFFYKHYTEWYGHYIKYNMWRCQFGLYSTVWSAWAYFRVEDPDTFVFSYILSLRCWKQMKCIISVR
jgi:hypothetical protein